MRKRSSTSAVATTPELAPSETLPISPYLLPIWRFKAGAAWRGILGCSEEPTHKGGRAATSYRPMTVADLAARLALAGDDKTRWKLVWEFLEEYRWEREDVQSVLLRDEPPSVGDLRWDALLAALAEHLAAKKDLAP